MVSPDLIRLCEVIETLQRKLEGLRQLSLKETPTRTILVDPLLEALGWDVRDPHEVQMEYPTVDGKSVDYALKINRKPIVLVEAKPLDDPLGDVKAVTQVVGYAANGGIASCILTNGVKWKVYRSLEECSAPDKLMFEVTLDPKEAAGVTSTQLAEQMWRFSLDETAKGTLDSLGEHIFTDGKVRKALERMMADPPRALLNLVRRYAADQGLSPRKIRESMERICTRTDGTLLGPAAVPRPEGALARPHRAHTRRAGALASGRRRREAREAAYDESLHTNGKPQEVLELYRAIDRLCLSLGSGSVEKRVQKKYVGYAYAKRLFCSVHLLQSGLRVWLKLKYARLTSPPPFARDVSDIGHWGTGDLELGINNLAQLDVASELIRKSFESQAPD